MTINPDKDLRANHTHQQPPSAETGLNAQENLDSGEVHLNNWRMNNEDQEFNKAIECLELAAKANNPEACLLLANIYTNPHNYSLLNQENQDYKGKAVELLERIPDNHNAQVRLIQFYFQKDSAFYNYDRGMEVLKKASEIDPNLQVKYGCILCGTDGGAEAKLKARPEEGLAILRKALDSTDLPDIERVVANETISKILFPKKYKKVLRTIDFSDNERMTYIETIRDSDVRNDNDFIDGDNIENFSEKEPTKLEKAMRSMKRFGELMQLEIKENITKVAFGILAVLGALLLLAGAITAIYFWPPSAIIIVPVGLAIIKLANDILRPSSITLKDELEMMFGDNDNVF